MASTIPLRARFLNQGGLSPRTRAPADAGQRLAESIADALRAAVLIDAVAGQNTTCIRACILYTEYMLVRLALRDQVRDLVLGQILDGTLQPGDRLSDQILAPRFNVSRTPMREALLELTREGVVASDVGRGFVVRPLTIREAAENYPILASLEVLALRTAPLPSRERLDQLRSLNDQLGRTIQPARRVELDRQWHRLLVVDCGNAHLLELIERLTTSLARYELAYMRSVKRAATSQTHHGKIVAALLRRDRDGAAVWLERNWTASADAIRGWLESGPAPRIA